MVEDVTSDFRFSAPIMANQIRYPAVTTTQLQQKQNTYANVVQNEIPIPQMPNPTTIQQNHMAHT